MSQGAPETVPMSAEWPEASNTLPRNGSTSSSDTSAPFESAVRPGPTLWVEMWENQRWYPVLGWGTSRFLSDLPAFCFVPPARRLCGAHPADFEAAFYSVNPPSPQAPDPQWAARRILTVSLPAGYRWVGFWEVYREHPHGTDIAGWRYGEQFLRPADSGKADASDSALHRHVLAPFKKTHTPLCVVRRRLWRRRVALMGADEPGPSPEDLLLSDAELQVQSYLSEKQEEMVMAEHLKEKEFRAAQAGEPWAQEEEMQAEEELRKFCRERRSLESASRMRSTNPSFANPFSDWEEAYRITSADSCDDAPSQAAAQLKDQYSGAVAASSWARDSQSNRAAGAVSSPTATGVEATVAYNATPLHDGCTFQTSSATAPSRVDGSDLVGQGTVHEFVASTSTDGALWLADGAEIAAQNTVDNFVASMPTDFAELNNDDQSAGVSIGGISDPTEANFRAIFSQFIAPSAGEKPS
ncbi:hypothetical protein LSCM1_01725 [Leishmania martiniquensis]|uniref:Uncharacterized protein n=1 Tax=Leishmania martiniquensis TaxID=1580590 RepID=A0A836KE32_9TRYP|nr:hypothetical protein LSCM1_01725 [Leishmania martiniquensis]